MWRISKDTFQVSLPPIPLTHCSCLLGCSPEFKFCSLSSHFCSPKIHTGSPSGRAWKLKTSNSSDQSPVSGSPGRGPQLWSAIEHPWNSLSGIQHRCPMLGSWCPWPVDSFHCGQRESSLIIGEMLCSKICSIPHSLLWVELCPPWGVLSTLKQGWGVMVLIPSFLKGFYRYHLHQMTEHRIILRTNINHRADSKTREWALLVHSNKGSAQRSPLPLNGGHTGHKGKWAVLLQYKLA